MKKNSCISCNLNSYTYIYALLLPISCMLIHFFQELMFQEYKHGNTEKTSFILLKYNLPLLFYYFLPKIFSIIFILILKIKSRGESDDVNGQNLVLRNYHISIRHEKTKQIILLIYLISLLEVIFKEGDFLLTYFNKTAQIGLLIEKRTGFIIFVPIFSFFILHKKLYKHHIFALILALIGSFILNFCRFPLNFAKKEDYPFHLIYIVFASFFSLSLVLIKFLFIKYLISPYNFLLYDGIFCIVNSLICGLLAYEIIININDKFLIEENKYYFKYNYLGIIYIFSGQNWLFFLSFFISFIASFLYFIFNVLTLFYFSPYLNVLTDFLTPFLLNILNIIFIKKKEKENDDNRVILKFIFENIGYFIIIFGALILNEIIIFNCFGLNENTYLKISDRGKIDSEYFEGLGPSSRNDEDDINTEEIGTDCDQTSNNS